MSISIKTDKIVLGLTLDVFSDEYARIRSFVSPTITDMYEGATYKMHVRLPWRKVKIPLDGMEHSLTIRLGNVQHQKRVLFDFNYEVSTPVARQLMVEIVDSLVDGGSHALVNSGQVSRLEIAIDIDHESYKDYLFLDPTLRGDRIMYRSIGTYYAGNRHGMFARINYDKGRHLALKKGIVLGFDRIRSEVMLRLPHVHGLPATAEITNPFENLLIVGRDALFKSKAPAAMDFRAIAFKANRSPRKAYGASVDRKALRLALAQCAPPWWKPHEVWKAYPASLAWTQP